VIWIHELGLNFTANRKLNLGDKTCYRSLGYRDCSRFNPARRIVVSSSTGLGDNDLR
jgi:hypothetical protein